VLASAQRSPGKYVIATEKSGLVEIVNGEVHNYDYSTYIQNASINFLFIDNTRQVWLASKKGLSHFVEKRFHLVNAISGLSNNKILAITADTRNAMWVGTTMGIASLENGPGSSMAMGLSHDLDKITVSCAARAPDGSIWYGTYGNGIIILKPGDNNWTVLNSQNGHLSNDNISNIYFAKDNTVYISTLGGGLIKAEVIPSASGTIRILKTYMENDGLGNSYVYCAITDERSRLFVASDGGGLQVLDKGKFVDLTRKFGLMSNTIFSLCKDRYNNIWAVSNADGIIKYTSHDSLIAITQANGLRELQPQQIIAVDNTLYAFNSKGVDKINCLNNSISYVDIFENDVEPNLNAVWYENGKILSGTTNGVLVFRTGSTRLDSIKPSAYISGLLVNYKPFPLDSIYEFKYKQNNIAISFGGVWLKNPEALSFRYRLNGLEEDWQYAEEAKTVNYNNLPPGEYTFILQSKNDEDIWSEPVGYYFVILTPLWKRWWFWLLIISIFSIGIYAFFRYRIRALKRQNQELESRVEERTREIAQQARIIEDKNKELERLSLVASKTDNSVLILDPDGRLEYVNESFFKLNGLTLDDLKRNYGETIFEFSNNPNITDLVNEAVTRKKSVHYESLNSKVKGETDIWESSTLTPIFDEQGILKKIIIIDTDVSKIKRQEQIITQKNKDITDSISYARKIQQAILPREGLIKKFLPNSFIVYLTKDIVSGDFYWFTHFNNCSIIAAVDCTGHGVPGAFMSIIGYSLLNRIINEKKVTDPAEILLELNNGVLNILHKNESESKDGMDIAVCKINHHQQTLEYAGAMRPLWLIANNELTEIKADKIPIGTKQKDREETIRYTTHVIPFTTGNSFYIFTDGYADQFGGSKDKKYSTARFKEFLTANASLNFGDQETAVRDEHYKWKGKNEQVDDILLIGFTA
jgi:PAS domain S-box-containing protein